MLLRDFSTLSELVRYRLTVLLNELLVSSVSSMSHCWFCKMIPPRLLPRKTSAKTKVNNRGASPRALPSFAPATIVTRIISRRSYNMASTKQMETTLLTEHFRWTPIVRAALN